MIVGRKHVDFTDDSGKRICGWSIFYTMKDDRTEGVMAGKMFISDAKAQEMEIPSVGVEYEVFYDRYGRANSFKPVK